MSVRVWPWLLWLATSGCTVGTHRSTDVVDTDTVETDVHDTDQGDTDTRDTAETGALDTDQADTDNVDTDDTDVADTDPSAFAVTIAPTHPTTTDDLVATVWNIPPGIGGLGGLLIVWSGPAPGSVFGNTVANALTEPGDTWTVTVHPVAATGIPDVEATVVIGP